MRTDDPGVLLCFRTLLCLIVCAAAFFVSVDAAFAHESDDGSVVVHATDGGFEPRSVEIYAGDTVVFENVGGEAHWPASDDHPTHEEYPEFDPKKPVQPDTEWSFTFDRPGKWKYHDHMNPYLTGEVVVRNDGDQAGPGDFFSSIKALFVNAYETALSALVGKEDSASAGGHSHSKKMSEEEYKEIRDEYTALVRDKNPRVALERLRDEIETNDALLGSCHPVVHDIGHAAYEKYGDVGEAMKYRDEVCNSGYLHGIIESRFSESDDVLADMKTMCDEYRPGGYVSWQCYHGLGHGAMFYTANDLPRSLEMCEAFDSSFGRSSCANGVFMENFSADQKLHLSKFLKESDPFYPCMEQAKRFKNDCYLYAPTYFLNLHPEDYAGALRWCKGAEAGFESACAYGVGMQTLKENLDDPKLAESVCMGGETEQTAPCVEGMASLYISHHGSLEPAREMCARLATPNRRACYASVEAYTPLFRS